MTRIIKVELENYNIEYDYEIKESRLRNSIIETFCCRFCLPNTYNVEEMIETYIGYEKLEEDFLEDTVREMLYEIEEEFEQKTAKAIEEIIKRNKSISWTKITDLLPYETLILNWDSPVFDLVLDSFEHQEIPYELDNDNQRITLKTKQSS